MEAIWRDYIREGKAEALFDEIRGLNGQHDVLPPCPEEFLEGMAPEYYARYEGALQYQALTCFDVETQAYERLSDLQGHGIPKLLAHVRLCIEPDLGSEHEDADTAKFFYINGIIMEQIDDFPLAGLASSLVPEGKWEGILQRTVETVTDINMRGVILDDCRSGNVLVEIHIKIPFIHDFAQSVIWDTSDKDFGMVVCGNQNPRNLVSGLADRLQKEENDKLNLVYPELHELIGLTKVEAEESWQIIS